MSNPEPEVNVDVDVDVPQPEPEPEPEPTPEPVPVPVPVPSNDAYQAEHNARHETLDESAVGFVDHPLGLGGDGGEHQ